MNNDENYDTESGNHSVQTLSDVSHATDNASIMLEEIPPIATLIKQERTKKKISQKKFSLNTDITNVHLSRIERGECVPSVRTLTRFAPYLGYPMETLLIASHYQGSLPSSTPTYVDLNGQVIDLEKAAQSMYHIDGELLLLIWNFYMNYTISDSELLKVLLKGIDICQRTTTVKDMDTNVSTNSNVACETSSNHLFVEAFKNLKEFIFSFSKLVHL